MYNNNEISIHSMDVVFVFMEFVHIQSIDKPNRGPIHTFDIQSIKYARFIFYAAEIQDLVVLSVILDVELSETLYQLPW